MKKFIKLPSNDEGALAKNLINIGDATCIQFTSSTACTIYYQYLASANSVITLSGITSGITVLMDSIEKAITANPGKVVVDLESRVGSVNYNSN